MARKLWSLRLVGIVLVLCVPLEGFFIDLETLGISTKSDGDSSDSKVLISTPSESTSASEYVEIDSKTDPNKSVRLTIEELKSLILGSVKEITSKPQPINIKISTEGRTKDPLVAIPPSTAPTQLPEEPPINVYKYQTKSSDSYNSNSNRYLSSTRESEDDDSSYWNVRPATAEDYKSNEVSSSPSSKETDGGGFLTMAKSVLRGPTKIMNSYSKSFSRWSSKPKSRSKTKPQRRPLPDITYRRRRKNSKPSYRRNRPRQRPRPQRRQKQRPSYSQASSYYGGDDYAESDYYEDNYRQHSSSRPSHYGNHWDRSDHLREDDFDSTMPYDDVPEDLMPPMRSSPTFY